MEEETVPKPTFTFIRIGAHLSLIFEPKQVRELNLTSAWATADFPHFYFPEPHLSFLL